MRDKKAMEAQEMSKNFSNAATDFQGSSVNLNQVRGKRSISQGFVAQYAAEAALRTVGVAGLERSSLSLIKESLGIEPETTGVEVVFSKNREAEVVINVYPIVYYEYNLPELAFTLQENIKHDVENYTDLSVVAVNVHVKDVVQRSL